MFINKVLLEHRYIHSFTHCLWPPWYYNAEWLSPTQLKVFVIWPCTKFADLLVQDVNLHWCWGRRELLYGNLLFLLPKCKSITFIVNKFNAFYKSVTWNDAYILLFTTSLKRSSRSTDTGYTLLRYVFLFFPIFFCSPWLW